MQFESNAATFKEDIQTNPTLTKPETDSSQK